MNHNNLIEVTKSLYVAQTVDQHLGFLQGDGMPEVWQLEKDGRLIEFTSQGPVNDLHGETPLVLNTAMEDLGDEFYFPTYQATVYNIEVEDFHTYYVGEMAVLVREMGAKE
ncbi:hypothetical protein ABHF33_11570 [Chitinibacter sp. FCG-7]|uniref:Uncharacterized protein n=1 Tax=Chitinibacter mangrovi TaxID=3153927 RepID=A0AAU7F823_9NEIS